MNETEYEPQLFKYRITCAATGETLAFIEAHTAGAARTRHRRYSKILKTSTMELDGDLFFDVELAEDGEPMPAPFLSDIYCSMQEAQCVQLS